MAQYVLQPVGHDPYDAVPVGGDPFAEALPDRPAGSPFNVRDSLAGPNAAETARQEGVARLAAAPIQMGSPGARDPFLEHTIGQPFWPYGGSAPDQTPVMTARGPTTEMPLGQQVVPTWMDPGKQEASIGPQQGGWEKGLEASLRSIAPRGSGLADVARAVPALVGMTPPGALASALEQGGQGNWAGAGLAALGAVPMAGAAERMGMKAAEESLGPSLTAYHASPHDFDKFDISKIGTGEGAQAYGHGLYFAEAEPTMEVYHKFFQGRGADWTNPHNVAFDAVNKAGGDKQAALDGLLVARRAQSNQMGKVNPELDGAIDLLQSGAEITPNMSGTAHRYQVQIHADPEHFLDWDKPLSEQHPKVQEALAQHGMALPSEAEISAANTKLQQSWDNYQAARSQFGYKDNRTGDAELAWQQSQRDLDNLQSVGRIVGSDAYQKVANRVGAGGTQDAAQPLSAQALRDAGIPGIKYLDAGSRGKGDGTRNYVTFSDDIISILKKYGLAGLGLGTGAAAMQGQGDQSQ